MKFVRLLDGRFVTFAFFGENVQQHRLVLSFQKFKRPDQQRNVVPVDRSVVTQAQFLENDARHDQTFHAFFDFMSELHRRFAGNRLYELTRFFVQMRERRAGRDPV